LDVRVILIHYTNITYSFISVDQLVTQWTLLCTNWNSSLIFFTSSYV